MQPENVSDEMLTRYGENGAFYAPENYIQDAQNSYCARNVADIMETAQDALSHGNAALYNAILSKMPAVLDLSVNPA